MNRQTYEPSREELLRAFGETPQAFKARIGYTLRRLTADQEECRVKRKLVLAPVLVLILALLLAGVAVAALYPRTAERFGELYGEDFGARLLQGDAAESGERCTLGSVAYTVTDVIYEGGVLYGTVVMEPAEGENVVLMPEDADVSEPAGYNIHNGEAASEDAKTYAQLAAERGARIVMAKCVPDGYVLDSGAMSGDIGYSDTVTQDGAIVSSFELYGWNGGIERADSYTLRFYLSSWEVTPQGEWLREEPDNTWVRETWDVTVKPSLRAHEPEPAPEPLSGAQTVVPEGFAGALPVVAVAQRDFRDTVKPEDFTFARLLETKTYDESVAYYLEGGVVLTVAQDRIDLSAYDGTQEVRFQTADGETKSVTVPRDAVTEYLYGLAARVYYDRGEVSAYADTPQADDLTLLTLTDAQSELSALLDRLGVAGAQTVYAFAMDMETARALSDARNAEIAAGAYPGFDPYDLSGMTERDEGFLLVARGAVDGVPADEAYLYVSAYVTVDGVRALTMSAPFTTGEAGEPQTLIAPGEALAYAVREAEKSWMPELVPDIGAAPRVELIYAVRDKARLVPAWQVLAFEEIDGAQWPVTVVVSALDGSVLRAPWL